MNSLIIYDMKLSSKIISGSLKPLGQTLKRERLVRLGAAGTVTDFSSAGEESL